jgi:hypothetical protein
MNKRNLTFATFVVECAETHLGDSIHAIGSLPELGEWDQRGIVSLATGDGVFPTWTGSVWLPAS